MYPNRRRPKAQPCAEGLESRSLLTGGAGSTFALMPGTIAQPGGAAEIKFTVDPTHFTLPKGKLTIGVDVVAAGGATVTPKIVGVLGPDGQVVKHLSRSHYAAKSSAASAVLVPVAADPAHPGQAQTYTLEVQGLKKTSGKFLVGFYLPGDANGDGVVDQADIQAIQAARGAAAGQTNYSFDADANRDGRVTPADLGIAKRNLGAKVTIEPLITANLDPATTSNPQSRITAVKTVHFTGTTTPGARITFTEAANKAAPASATADASGSYNLFATLGDGSNTFKVSSTDAFGQTISGQIAPVNLVTDTSNVLGLAAAAAAPKKN